MKFLYCERAKLWCCVAALSCLAAGLFSQQNAMSHRDPQLEQSERNIKRLRGRFAEILAPTSFESQLRAKCQPDCGAILDPQSGLTVGRKLEEILGQKQSDLARVGAEIQRSVDEYIERSVSTSDGELKRPSVIKDLSYLLSGVADPPPTAFVLSSGQHRALLIFDNIQNGTMGDKSSYATLTAFNAEGPKLTRSDSTGTDMDGYGGIDVKELHSPVEGQIWLLVSGYMTGANGPNCRMRVFAYDGKRFRTVWAPANMWGTFTVQVTRSGFVVRGEYYRSTVHRNDRYWLAPDGLYQGLEHSFQVSH